MYIMVPRNIVTIDCHRTIVTASSHQIIAASLRHIHPSIRTMRVRML